MKTGNQYTEAYIRETLEPNEWRSRKSAHEQRVSYLIDDYLERRQHHEKDPILDFLFEYYSFRPSHLKRWSPGFGILLRGASFEELRVDELTIDRNRAFLQPDQFPESRKRSLRWICHLLENIQHRPPSFGCFGMHEWAMVYKAENVRHDQIPLRLSRDEITDFVESRPLVCTHFDAFRFFTDQARPMNKFQLSRDQFSETEQAGCLHTNMDLYKWAFKMYPWISSKLIRTAFELALEARVIDMKASPYDLSDYDLEPIKIETEEGRQVYLNNQKAIYDKARPVRKQLLKAYRTLMNSVYYEGGT